MSFFKKLFSLFTASAGSPSTAAKPAPTAAPVVAPPPPPSVLMQWREALDAQGNIAAHLVQPCALTPNATASGAAIGEAWRTQDITALAGNRPVILSLTAKQWREADFSAQLGPQTYILLAGLTLQTSLKELREWAAQIRAEQAGVAVDDALLPVMPELLELADLVRVDVSCQTLPVLERKLQTWRTAQPGLRLLANGVDDWAEQRLYHSLGFSYCAGPFIGRIDSHDSQEKIGESRLVVMDMLNALRQDNALSEVTAIAKRDPAVVVKLLERVNSPIYGLGRQVGSLDEVVMILGREALYRWLSIALFSLDGGRGRDQTLLFLALCRASLLETLAPNDRQQAAELFLVGLLSVVDSLLGLPRAKVLEKMHLAAPVVAVLRDNAGPYAQHWALAQALEQGEIEQTVALAEALQINMAKLSENYHQAITLAQTVAFGQA